MNIELMKRKQAVEVARSKTNALWLAGETGSRNWRDATHDETLAQLYYLSANRLPGLTVNAVMMLALTGIVFLITWSLTLAG